MITSDLGVETDSLEELVVLGQGCGVGVEDLLAVEVLFVYVLDLLQGPL